MTKTLIALVISSISSYALACGPNASCPDPLAIRCRTAIVEAGCNIAYGQRAALCNRASSQAAVEAVKKAMVANQCDIQDDVLSSLLRIDSRAQLGCVDAIIGSSCNIAYGNRASLCLRSRSSLANSAIRQAMSSTTCDIQDDTLSSLLRIDNSSQRGCVDAIIGSGCNIAYGNRASLCLRSTCAPANASVRQVMTSHRCDIQDDVLSQLIY